MMPINTQMPVTVGWDGCKLIAEVSNWEMIRFSFTSNIRISRNFNPSVKIKLDFGSIIISFFHGIMGLSTIYYWTGMKQDKNYYLEFNNFPYFKCQLRLHKMIVSIQDTATRGFVPFEENNLTLKMGKYNPRCKHLSFNLFN